MKKINIFIALIISLALFGCKMPTSDRATADSMFFSESRPPVHFQFDKGFRYYGSTSSTVTGEYVDPRNLKPFYKNESYYYCCCDDSMRIKRIVIIEILTWSTTTKWAGLPSSGRTIEDLGGNKYKCTYHLVDAAHSARHIQFVESKGLTVPDRVFVKLLVRNVEPSLDQRIQITYAEDAEGASFSGIDWDKYKINYGKTKQQAHEIIDKFFEQSVSAVGDG